MKKEYNKPEIAFEDFSLSTNIAGDCEHDTSLQSDANGCGLIWGDEIIFLTDVAGCIGEGRTAYETDGDFSGICYHNPSDLSNVFNS